MYLIFKRLNPTSVILFNSLDEIKEATETEVYGKYISDETRSSGTENNYSNFELISNSTFPYVLCEGYNYIKNIILDVSKKTGSEYYLLDEYEYAHGDWNWPSIDGKKIIFDDLNEMKKYCKSVQENLRYLDGDCLPGDCLSGDCLPGDCLSDYKLDEKLIDEKFIELENYKGGNYPEGLTQRDSKFYTYHYNKTIKKYEKDYKNVSLEKFKLVLDYMHEAFNFTIGNDFHVDFTIHKIKNNTYWK